MKSNEPKEATVFSVMDPTGAIVRLIQADSVKQVKAMVTPEIGRPSTMTVAKLVGNGMPVEVAK